MTHRLDVVGGRDIVARWCALAERRLEYLTELFETGRWRRFHSEPAFLENIREAKAAVETWRDLLSREASRNNTAIDMSWLGRATAVLSREGSRRDQLHLRPRAEISTKQTLENSVLPLSDARVAPDALSAQAMGNDTTAARSDLAAIAERYPLLHNAL